MKTRIQLAGGEFASKEATLWSGALPLISIAPGMQIVLYGTGDDESVDTYAFSQACLEIPKGGDEAEQVIYVKPKGKTKAALLTE